MQLQSSLKWLLALTCLVGAAPVTSQVVPAGDVERLYSTAELREDFERLYQGLQAAHFSLFAFTPKREFDRRYAQARTELNAPLTRFQAKLRFQLFAAAARMGHTRVESPAAEWRKFLGVGGKAFPLSIRIIEGRAYVAENLSGMSTIGPGDEILKVNGEGIPAWLERTERHVSAETRYMADSLMEFDFALYLWTELGAPEQFDIEFRRFKEVRRIRVAAFSQESMDAVRSRQPPALDIEHPLRDFRILVSGVAYLRPGPFYNVEAKSGAEAWDVSGFREFIDRAFERFSKAGADRLIIDLRSNPGGDNLFSDVLVSWFATRPFRFASQFKVRVSDESIAANAARIAHDAAAAGPVSQQFAALYAGRRNGEVVDFPIPLAQPRAGAHFEGKVFVLVDRQSYSNAVSVAALVQDYRFGTILGEETSDMATTYGAMEQFTLPHTGLSVGYPKARIVRPSADQRSRGVRPDVIIRIPVLQTAADEVLQRAESIAIR
jgi:hypothetical protein